MKQLQYKQFCLTPFKTFEHDLNLATCQNLCDFCYDK